MLLGECGGKPIIGQNVVLRHPHKIRLGVGVIIDDNCLLDAKGAAYHELDVTEDARIEAQMISRSGRTTAPQIFVDDVHIGDSARLAQLERDCKLNTILAGGCDASERKS